MGDDLAVIRGWKILEQNLAQAHSLERVRTPELLFGMLAADKLPFIGYHMPFPAVGFVEARGEGFHYVPGQYQMMMNG